MPKLTITITGLCAYAHQPNDERVDVLFVNARFAAAQGGGGHGGHGDDGSDIHTPMLWVSAADTASIKVDGKGDPDVVRPASAGLPVYLAQFTHGLIRLDEKPMSGKVEVVRSPTAVGAVPSVDAEWEFFDWVPDLNALYKGSAFAKDALTAGDRTLFVLSLHGGRLTAAQPSKNKGKNPWNCTIPGEAPFDRAVTDLVRFTVEHAAEQVDINLIGRPNVNDLVLKLRTDRDVEALFTHEPAVAVIPDPVVTTLRHISLLATAMFDPAPTVHPVFTKKPEACPLIPDCPPGRIRVGG